MKRFLRGVGNPNPCFLLMGMLVLSFALSRLSPYFWTGRNIANIIDQASVGIILSMGMTFVVAAAGIDLNHLYCNYRGHFALLIILNFVSGVLEFVGSCRGLPRLSRARG